MELKGKAQSENDTFFFLTVYVKGKHLSYQRGKRNQCSDLPSPTQ